MRRYLHLRMPPNFINVMIDKKEVYGIINIISQKIKAALPIGGMAL